jgi:hypothetical protein
MEYSGIEALEGYRWNWSELLQCYSNEPIHDWSSHTADAFRGLACVAKFAKRMAQPEEPKVAKEVKRLAPTLDQLWQENQDATDRRI